MMTALYNIVLLLVSVVHLSVGLGNLLKLPPLYRPEKWMVGDEVGAGETGAEKMMETIVAGCYTSSILGVLLAYCSRYIKLKRSIRFGFLGFFGSFPK